MLYFSYNRAVGILSLIKELPPISSCNFELKNVLFKEKSQKYCLNVEKSPWKSPGIKNKHSPYKIFRGKRYVEANFVVYL